VDVALVTGAVGPSFMHEVDTRLVAALRERGAAVHTPCWSDVEVAWDAFDLAVVRTTWDYVDDRDAFVAWAAATAERTALWNPADVLRWNTHKSYLLELEDRGAPVVPTAWLAQGDRIDLADLLASRGWSRAVVKPAVAAGSQGLARVDAAAAAAGQRHLDALLAVGDAMVQAYLPSVETRGELSVVVVDGEVSHAVRKLPAAGEFRIQEEFGGRYVEEELDRDTTDLAAWIVETAGTELLLARVDLLEDEVGTLQLAELEATEPDLYLDAAPDAAARVADAILRRAGTITRPSRRDVRS
jgi:glutathione synthase/RimK-type ligase-like ATP-grasp enzyme